MLNSMNEDPLLNSADAATYLDVKTNTLAIWRSTGRYQIPYCKIGRNVRYRKSDLDAFLAGSSRTFVEQEA